MRIQTLARARSVAAEPPRATAYYYADLERLKQREPGAGDEPPEREERAPAGERARTGAVPGDGAVREVPPLRDRVAAAAASPPRYATPEPGAPCPPRCDLPEYTSDSPEDLYNVPEYSWKPPDGTNDPQYSRKLSNETYNTPEYPRKLAEETYSTAGTFPMREPKEKEPLLAELEAVGRLPLTQLAAGSAGGPVRRSRSWYLCCPDAPDEDAARASSWRYSSLRPVTAPPAPAPASHSPHLVVRGVASVSSERAEDAASLRAERDALVRALAAERARAAAAARAHDARLAELHGVIAELVRRRAADQRAGAIPEEEVSDECESTTQPAGELDNDADHSRTELNTPSLLSPLDARLELQELPDDTSDTSRTAPPAAAERAGLQLCERDSELCLSTARCCQSARQAHGAGAVAGDSCERDHGSADEAAVHTATPSPGGRESRQAKLASRVRLRRTEHGHAADERRAGDAAERLALDVCAQADLREALVAANNDGSALSASVCAWRARCARLEADCRVLQCALARATDTAQRLSCACAVQESSCVALCCALRCADRALETYDVLLALAETQPGGSEERAAAELVARRLLARLEGGAARVGEPLLSPGPWLLGEGTGTGAAEGTAEEHAWSADSEARLRRHAARLKSDTVTLRELRAPPHLFSYHDVEEEAAGGAGGGAGASAAEMEAAVMLQEVLAAREARAAARAAGGAGAPPPPHLPLAHAHAHVEPPDDCKSGGRRRARHWLDSRAAETDL